MLIHWNRVHKALANAPYALQVILVGVCYYLGARLGLYLSFAESNIGALWPPNAVLLTALLLQPRRRWWGFLLVAIPAEVAADLPVGISLSRIAVFLLADYTEVLVGASLLSSVLSGTLQFRRLPEMIAFIAAAVIVAPLVAAFPGAAAGGLDLADPDFWARARTWFLSDALTHVVFTPLLVVLFGPAGSRARARSSVGIGEQVAVVASLVVTALMLFRYDPPSEEPFHALFYLPIPLLVWAAVRLGPRYCFGSSMVLALLAVWSASRGYGPYAMAGGMAAVVDLQASLLLSLTPILLLSIVIEERGETRKALAESEEKYRLIVDHAGDMVVKTDAEGNLLYVSPEYCRVFGKPEPELVGRPFLPLVHEEDRAATGAFMEQLRHAPYTSYVEHRAQTRRGWQWIAWRGKGVLDDAGSLVATIGVGRNIQSLKDAEEERESLRERLVRAEKLEALNLLAGGVAHDLNNILSGVISYPDLLLMDLPLDSEMREPLETIRDSGFRAAAVVRDMAGLARGMDTTPIPGSLSRIVHEYLSSNEHGDLMRRNLDVDVQPEVDAGVLGISCAPFQLRKAVANLILNAVEASGPAGKVVVQTANRYVERPLKAYETIPAGEYVVLVVSDSGRAVSDEDLPRLFDPFYTRKVLGWGGTGLGLTVVWNIVHDHSGYIDVQSGESGTTFTLYFPATRMAVPAPDEIESARGFEGNGEHILVVDDEPAQRRIAQHILERLKYRVATEASGEAAVKHLESYPVDLVLLDMIMPHGMDGRETYMRLVEIQPNLKAVVASGFADRDTVKAMHRAGVCRYIEKPYTMLRLGREVYDELHADRRAAD